MGNPYLADFLNADGSVRFGGEVTFTDPGNQPGGGGSQPGAAIVRAFPFAFDSAGIQERAAVPIMAVNQGTQTFTVASNQVAGFAPGNNFTVSGSTGNDGLYTIVSAAFGGGSTAVVVVEAIPDGTADGTIAAYAGIAVYTPTINDRWLDAWIEVDTPWDGTTPKGDFGQLSGSAFGVLGDIAGACDMTNVDAPIGGGTSPSNNVVSITDVIIVAANSNQTNRFLPGKFVTADPICVWVTQDGKNNGADSGALQGTGTLCIVTATPA